MKCIHNPHESFNEHIHIHNIGSAWAITWIIQGLPTQSLNSRIFPIWTLHIHVTYTHVYYALSTVNAYLQNFKVVHVVNIKFQIHSASTSPFLSAILSYHSFYRYIHVHNDAHESPCLDYCRQCRYSLAYKHWPDYHSLPWWRPKEQALAADCEKFIALITLHMKSGLLHVYEHNLLCKSLSSEDYQSRV